MTRREDLRPGDRIKFLSDSRWWTVRAADGKRFVILTRQAEFQAKGNSLYTIIDWERGVRGPCNLIGQGWDVDAPNGCEDLLRALHYQLEISARLAAGEKSVPVEDHAVEVSHRNNVPIEITALRIAPTGGKGTARP